jgi:hypothetical protein
MGANFVTERRFKGGQVRSFSTDSVSNAADLCPIRVAPLLSENLFDASRRA